jgi:hypothetical protein
MLLFVNVLVHEIMHVFMHVLVLYNLAVDLVVHRIAINSSSGTMATCTTSWSQSSAQALCEISRSLSWSPRLRMLAAVALAPAWCAVDLAYAGVRAMGRLRLDRLLARIEAGAARH